VTAAKLTALKAKIDAYSASLSKPRDAVASGSTATKLMGDAPPPVVEAFNVCKFPFGFGVKGSILLALRRRPWRPVFKFTKHLIEVSSLRRPEWAGPFRLRD
jgi:hypothetical protein